MSEKKRSAKEFFMDNNKKNLKIFIIVVVAILVLAAVTMGIYVFAKVGLINIDKDGKVNRIILSRPKMSSTICMMRRTLPDLMRS